MFHRILPLLLMGFALAPSPADAQSCSFSMPSFDFGDIDLTDNTTSSLTASLTMTCTGVPNATIRVCPNIGSGSGGAAPSGNPRYMLDGANQLAFNIFRNAAFTNVWGSVFWQFVPPQVTVNLNNAGVGTRSRVVRVRIPAGQTSLPAGLYTSSFMGGNTLFAYAYRTGGQNCNTIGATNGVQVPFTVQARNTGSCTVSATDLNFGNLTLLNTNYDQTSALTVNCTSNVSYNVGLNGGLTNAADPTQRKMSFAADEITYGLYRDPARTLPWGNTIGSDTEPGTGSGANQTLTVYGRIAPQATPPAGTYSDTVIVTVTY